MNGWIPKVGNMALTEGVSVLGEVKEKGCPAREREFRPHACEMQIIKCN